MKVFFKKSTLINYEINFVSYLSCSISKSEAFLQVGLVRPSVTGRKFRYFIHVRNSKVRAFSVLEKVL